MNLGALAEGLAFAAFVLAAAWLEVSGKPAWGLWFIAGLWVFTTDWGQKK